MWPAHLLAIAAFGVTVLSVIYPSATRQYTWPWAPLLALAWLTPLAAIMGRLAFKNSWNLPNSLLGAGLGILAGTTLVSAAFSPFAHQSLLRIWPTMAGTFLFFWLHDWLAESPARTELLFRALAVFGGLVATVSLIGWSWHSGGISWSARNDFPFGHSIYTAGAMLLILPWLVHASWKTTGVMRAAWMVAAMIAFLALLATSSRGGVLAAGTVSVILAAFAVFRAAWSRQVKAGVVALIASVLVLAVWSNPRLRELAHGHGWNEGAKESNTQRNAMLQAGAILGASRPLIGWGPGTVPLTYPQVRRQLSGGVDNVLQLHNTPAQLWATLGGGGAIALAILLAAFVRRLGQITRRSSFSPVTLASGASLLGYGLFSLADHQLDVPAMNALLVVNLALFFVGERAAQPIPVTRAAKWRIGVVGLLFLAPSLMLTGKDLLARYAYDQSLILFDEERFEDGVQFLETAAQRAPYDPYYRHQLANRLLDRRAHVSDVKAQAQLTSAATAQLEQSLAAGCFQEFANFNLGWLTLEGAKPSQAIPYFLATVREAPHRGGAYFGLGLALRAAGNESAAIRAFSLEWIDDPIAFASPLWEWTDFAPLRPQIIREADHLIAELAPTKPTARYVRELWNWWEQGTPLPAFGFDAESNAFARSLSLAATAPKQTNFSRGDSKYNWALLFKAWKDPSNHDAFVLLTHNDEPLAAALARRAARHPPPDLRGFLTAGLENDPHLLQNMRFSRLGYGVLALHPDGPVLTNLYVAQQNRLVSIYAASLFPSKGWIQAKELLDRLPVLPAEK